MKKILVTAVLVAGVCGVSVYAQAASAGDTEIIRRAQRASVAELEKQMPDEPLGEWLKKALGPTAVITWETNDCGEQDGSGRQKSIPVCADAEAKFPDGLQLSIWIAVGTQEVQEPEMPPDFSMKPVIWWAALSFQEHQLDFPLRLADVPELVALTSAEKVSKWCRGRLDRR